MVIITGTGSGGTLPEKQGEEEGLLPPTFPSASKLASLEGEWQRCWVLKITRFAGRKNTRSSGKSLCGFCALYCKHGEKHQCTATIAVNFHYVHLLDADYNTGNIYAVQLNDHTLLFTIYISIHVISVRLSAQRPFLKHVELDYLCSFLVNLNKTGTC